MVPRREYLNGCMYGLVLSVFSQTILYCIFGIFFLVTSQQYHRARTCIVYTVELDDIFNKMIFCIFFWTQHYFATIFWTSIILPIELLPFWISMVFFCLSFFPTLIWDVVFNVFLYLYASNNRTFPIQFLSIRGHQPK